MGGGGTTSTGRGGAGNIQPSDNTAPPLDERSLHTPTLKSDHYTTGRGGSGNMAKNDHENPAEARRAQDVDVPASIGKKDEGSFHTGRGGAANIVKGEESAQRSGSPNREGVAGLVDKGKNLLGLNKK